ncbi:MAG: hypothetical protein ABIP42_16490, partial [Planctomycetota bacterium]
MNMLIALVGLSLAACRSEERDQPVAVEPEETLVFAQSTGSCLIKQMRFEITLDPTDFEVD